MGNGLFATSVTELDCLVEILSVTTLAEGQKIAFVAAAWSSLFKGLLPLSNFDLLLALFQSNFLKESLFFLFEVCLAFKNVLYSLGDIIDLVEEFVGVFLIKWLLHLCLFFVWNFYICFFYWFVSLNYT